MALLEPGALDELIQEAAHPIGAAGDGAVERCLDTIAHLGGPVDAMHPGADLELREKKTRLNRGA